MQRNELIIITHKSFCLSFEVEESQNYCFCGRKFQASRVERSAANEKWMDNNDE